MDHSDVQHHDRFEQMKSEVNRREIDWWYYRPDSKVFDEGLEAILKIIRQQMPVGPFGHRFVTDHQGFYKPSFYDIPLQQVLVKEKQTEFTGVGYVATNDTSSILLSNAFDYLRNKDGYQTFLDTNLAAICVQTAENSQGRKMVVAMNCISKLTPLTYYEHPANGRLLMAMNGSLYPDQTALVLGGDVINAKQNIQETLSQATTLYNLYDIGEIEQPSLVTSLATLYF